VVDRHLGGVGSIAPLMPNNSRPGPAVPISVPVKRRVGPSTRPVRASDEQIRTETQLGHGLRQDVLLALLRLRVADRRLLITARPRAANFGTRGASGYSAGYVGGQPHGAAGVPPALVASSVWSYSAELATLERRRPISSA
jgi:hypothetical protein